MGDNGENILMKSQPGYIIASKETFQPQMSAQDHQLSEPMIYKLSY